jgi:hypothetical protein
MVLGVVSRGELAGYYQRMAVAIIGVLVGYYVMVLALLVFALVRVAMRAVFV